MHTVDLKFDHLTKVEGAATLDIAIRDGRVESVHFKIEEYKRFFTKAMEGKPIAAIPQLLARICGTCSNAHILCSIEACEHALDIEPSLQTKILRQLTMYGLNIRDHALHLYLFAMPDIYGKDAFLDFDENDPEQHQLLHDAFEIKAAGNYLATIVAGRSVHAIYPTIGGFNHFPGKEEIDEAIKKLGNIRPAVLRLIDVFQKAPFHFDRKTNFMALVPKDVYGFIDGVIKTDDGEIIEEKDYRDHLERIVLPYSQASAYQHKRGSYMVGALARMNLAKDLLHARTKSSLRGAAHARIIGTNKFFYLQLYFFFCGIGKKILYQHKYIFFNIYLILSRGYYHFPACYHAVLSYMILVIQSPARRLHNADTDSI